MDAASTPGDDLRRRRERLGLTQEMFAYEALVSVATLRRYETGKALAGHAHERINQTLLRLRIEQIAPAVDRLAAALGDRHGLAERAIAGDRLGPTALEQVHRALDELEEEPGSAEAPSQITGT